MRITVFTSNQPRHQALIERLATIGHEVFAVQECSTVFPGRVQDFFNKSPVMQDYFARVIAAEQRVFGGPRFLPGTVRQLPVRMGDLSQIDPGTLGAALEADVYVVFGASYIRGPICEHLVRERAVNLHMGVSPQYRGSSTNFWAMYDGRPQYVGATVHLLSAGLDSGPMLFHALPAPAEVDPFDLGMLAVKAAHEGLIKHLLQGTLRQLPPVPQDRSQQLRYTRNADFTDAVASEYLKRLPTPRQVCAALEERDLEQFIRPVVIYDDPDARSAAA